MLSQSKMFAVSFFISPVLSKLPFSLLHFMYLFSVLALVPSIRQHCAVIWWGFLASGSVLKEVN